MNLFFLDRLLVLSGCASDATGANKNAKVANSLRLICFMSNPPNNVLDLPGAAFLHDR
jgi:hypothetical protein